MRLESAVKNIKYSILTYILNYILKFVVRFVFIKYLSIEFLGINGLLGNILTVFSFAEMGIGTAVVFSLYGPLARAELDTVKALVQLLKKAYHCIGYCIFFMGILFLPWLEDLIQTGQNDLKIEFLSFYYLIFLLNTCISYFYSYKISLLQADQKQYIYSFYHSFFQMTLSFIQIVFLIYCKSYAVYIILMCSFTFLENRFISQKVDELYPFLKNKIRCCLNKDIKKDITYNVKALVIHRVSDIMIGSSANLILSKFVGLAVVGVFSNYMMVITAVEALLAQTVAAITATIGNMVASENNDRKNKIFEVIEFIVAWQAMLLATGFYVLLNGVISIWIGEIYTVDKLVLICIVLQFYLRFMRRAIWVFRDAFGLYWQDRYKSVAEMLVNLAAGIYFTVSYGMVGVVLGGILSTLLTSFWIEPYILFNNGLDIRLRKYFMNYLKFSAITFFIMVIVQKIYYSCFREVTVLNLSIGMFLCIVIPNVIWIFIFRNRDEFKYLANIIRNRIFNKGLAG